MLFKNLLITPIQCSEEHAVSGMSLKPFKKLAAPVLSGLKTLGYTLYF